MLGGDGRGKNFGGGTLKIFLATAGGPAKTGHVVKTQWKVLISIAGMVALATVFWTVSRPTEPSYEDKPLSYWLKGECECGLGPHGPKDVTAVRAIGTNAIPYLLRELQARDLPGMPVLEWFASKLPFTWDPPSASTHQFQAITGFRTLGTMAAPAIPKLTELMFGPELGAVQAAQAALEGIGGPAVFPLMLRGLTNATLAPGSAGYFASLRSQARAAVPALVTNLAATDPQVRWTAAFALGRIGLQPQLVVPALTPLVSDADRSVRQHAISALATFGQDAASATAVLQSASSDSNRMVSQQAKWALQRIQCEMRGGAIVRGPKQRKTMAIVFTGHEFAEGGEMILDELKRRQAKASFFFTGDFVRNASFEPLLGRIINGNHLLGPHSDKHLLYCSWEADRKTLVTQEQFKQDLESNRERIRVAIDRLAAWRKDEHAGVDPAMLEAFRRRYGMHLGVPGQVSNSNQVSYSNQVSVPICLYFLPAYEHYNRQIADWTAVSGMTLINFTPGTRSNADYTGEADKNFVSSQVIFDSILKQEREDPNGLNGFILLLHIGSGPGRADKFHTRFGELLDVLAAKGYQFVRVDELLEPKGTP